jgi:hypothetical protein
MDLINKIKADIERKREEIAKLEIALDVCQQLSGKKAKEEVVAEAAAPLFTVRKKSASGSAKKPPVVDMRAARPAVLKLLKSHGPMKSGEIVRLSGIPQKTIYNVMYALNREGAVVKEDNNAYRLPDADAEPETPNPADADPTAIGEQTIVEGKDNAAA